ncbi:uncharacterized protein LOC134542382 [Bacillus rossius redtenbacheri]|uniref:uncharacterized protein LOC134542382 n=1 Tax=Bacillus rossius redtenbacheri TaxID=93214 RepID=UPI002FDD4B61
MAGWFARTTARLDKKVPARLQPAWNHPAGPKTVFFWCPLVKWGLVLAGLGDLQRPPERISGAQSGALAVTGAIWARYSVVIVPKNWGLVSVNVFVSLCGLYSLSRLLRYQYYSQLTETST